MFRGGGGIGVPLGTNKSQLAYPEYENTLDFMTLFRENTRTCFRQSE